MGGASATLLPMTLMEKAIAEQIAGEAPPLHLPDLYIEGFRGIDLLEIPRLGRVTLLAGRNGIGKTTVLEAVRVYATFGDPTDLAEILLSRHERSGDVTSDNPPAPDWKSLFNGRNASRIEIGALDASRLTIEDEILSNEKILRHTPVTEIISSLLSMPSHALRITRGPVAYTAPLVPMRGGTIYPLKWYDDDEIKHPFILDGIDSIFVSSAVDLSDGLYGLWDKVIENGDEERVVKAVRIVDDQIEDVHITGNTKAGGSRAMAKLKSGRGRVPLHSRGEGAVRVFEIATYLTENSNGFLLIDEASNLLHYTVQRDFWRMVLQTAQDNNVQVLATTHSMDCIRGFAEAANDNKDVEGVLYRLSRKGGPLRAIEYDEDDMAIASRQGIEVR